MPIEGVVLGEMMGNSAYWSTDCFWWPLVNLIRDKIMPIGKQRRRWESYFQEILKPIKTLLARTLPNTFL